MKNKVSVRITLIIISCMLSLFFYSCASRRDAPLPYPDLAFVSVTQRPSPVLTGRSAKLDIELTNQGEIQAPATSLSLRDEAGNIIYDKKIPSLYPGVTITLTMALPVMRKRTDFTLTIDPDRKVYETNRLNNTIVVGVNVADEQRMETLDRKNEEEFNEALKRNNADHCRDKIRLNCLKRPDKTMSFESAASGELVKFFAEIENTCDREVYNITLRWTATKINSSSSGESIFGQVRIEHLLPGGKSLLYRSFRPTAGRWEVGLKIIFEDLPSENEIRLKPSFILIVSPQE